MFAVRRTRAGAAGQRIRRSLGSWAVVETGPASAGTWRRACGSVEHLMIEIAMPRTQLDLFADTRPGLAAPSPSAGGWPSTPRGEPQLGLYDARSLLLQRARDAFARGCLDEAVHHYAELHARDPDDVVLAREAAFAANIRHHLAAAASAAPDGRPLALLAVADELASAREDMAAALRRKLLREAALQAATTRATPSSSAVSCRVLPALGGARTRRRSRR
jgi:hypothetical protein